jgi:hypothetical protein
MLLLPVSATLSTSYGLYALPVFCKPIPFKKNSTIGSHSIQIMLMFLFFLAESKDIRGEREGFRGLWKRVKPMEKPEEVCRFCFYVVPIDGLGGIQGIPFDTRDSMFNPPSSRPFPDSNDLPSLSGPEQPPLSADFLYLPVCFLSLDRPLL